MATEENIIVAIELGSSKVTGAAGKKLADGSIKVLAFVEENSASFIQRGVIYNIEKCNQCLNSIINKMENQLRKKIQQVYVGFCGQGVHSVHNSIVRILDNNTIVSQQLVDEIRDENKEASLGDKKSFDVVPQEFVVDSKKTTDPVGILANRIEGNFLNLVTRTSVQTNMSDCFKETQRTILEYFCSPLVLAGSILSEADKRSGCALVDFGKDTTSVSVYKGNLLRYLTVIPLGMGNITKDLMSLQIEEDEAEELRLKYGSAYTDLSEEDENTKYTLRDGRSIEKKKLCDIIEARTEEILINVDLQISKSGYGRDTLLAGLVLTGGGSNMKDLEKAFHTSTQFEKIRTAKTVTFHVESKFPQALEKNGRHNVILGLLDQCKTNCCADEQEKVQPTLFGEAEEQNANAEVKAPTAPLNPIDQLAAKEKERQEEAKRLEEEKEARRKEEEEKAARKKAIEEAKRIAAEEKKKKRKEFFKNIGRKISSMFMPEEE